MANMTKQTGWLVGVVAIASTAAVIAFARLGPGLKLADPIWAPATSVVTALLITTLFVERSMAVINALIFGDEQRRAELQLLGAATPEQGSSAQAAVAQVLSSKERLRLLLGFVAGLFVSAAGMRTLAGLLASPQPTAIHPWFNPVDVVLTAGLIAGGSNGLAFLLQVLKDRAAGSGGSSGGNPAALTVPRATGDGTGATGVTHAQLHARMVTTS